MITANSQTEEKFGFHDLTSDRRSMAGIPHHTKTSYNYVKIDEHN
jgi:hypothetical protein